MLEKAKMPSADAMRLHRFYKGKIETTLNCMLHSFNDFAIWYTPGVAAPGQAVEANPDVVYDYTNKWNTVIVVSDSTRVLGLGDIGPKAALSVMEGKALLHKCLGGVDRVPIMLDTKDSDAIIIVDDFNCTGLPGMFAASDVTNNFSEQAMISVGEGAKAALNAYEYLPPML